MKPKLPQPGEIPFWTTDLEEICREIAANEPGWSWTSGGCFAFSEIFHEVFGGTLYGVCAHDEQSQDYPVHHALIQLGGLFYDYRGQVAPSVCISECQADVTGPVELKRKDDEDVFWFEDDFLSDEQFARLRSALLKGAEKSPKKNIKQAKP